MAFARRDLIPLIGYLPLRQWQRFRDRQVGIQRNDPATEDQLYAVKRGLQIAQKMLPYAEPPISADVATNYRAELVDEIDAWRGVNGKSPDDATIANMLRRYVPTERPTIRTLELDPRFRPQYHQVGGTFNRGMTPANAAAAVVTRGAAGAARAAVDRAIRAATDAAARAAAAVQAAPTAGAAGAFAMAQAFAAFNEAIGKLADAMDEEVRQYPYVGNFERILPKNAPHAATQMGFAPADNPPIDAHGETVFYDSATGRYIVRASDVRTPGVWEVFDKQGNRLGFYDQTLTTWFPDPPLNPGFTWAQPRPRAAAPAIHEAKALTPDEERAKRAAEQRAKQIAAQKARELAALAQGGITDETPPPPDDNSDDDNEDEANKSTDPSPRKTRPDVPMTNPEARAKAEELGYRPTNDYPFRNKRRALVFEKEGKFITKDYDVHRGRGWKMFDLDGKRIGTFTEDLTIRIGP